MLRPGLRPRRGERRTVVIDVRTASEYAEGHLDGAYIVYCRSGNRSAPATARMVKFGFSNITDAGGISDASASTGLAIASHLTVIHALCSAWRERPTAGEAFHYEVRRPR